MSSEEEPSSRGLRLVLSSPAARSLRHARLRGDAQQRRTAPILKFTWRDRRLRIAKAVIEGKEHIHTTSLQAICKVAIIRSVVGLRRWASGLRLCMSTSGGVGLTPGQGTKIPHALWQSQKQQQKNIVEKTDGSVEQNRECS